MALSETVQESMREAESHLRNALSFASKPYRYYCSQDLTKTVIIFAIILFQIS